MKLDAAPTPVPPGPFVHEEWPYEPRFERVNGWRMHCIDEGAGDPVVLLHGNPAWGFLYRKFVKPLTAASRRVINPDMIGFGLSEKPVHEQAHSLDGHKSHELAAAARRSQRDHGLSRLGRPDRSRLCTLEF
jgi:pimeloyl-ACP methyl ester carboxylesterase